MLPAALFVKLKAAKPRAFWLVYRNRLRENTEHSVRQQATSNISRSLLQADFDNWKEPFFRALGFCATSVGCERAYFARLSEDGNGISSFCQWPEKSGISKADKNRTFVFLSELNKKLDSEKILTLAGDAPDDLALAMDLLQIRTVVAVPVLHEETKAGLLCFASARDNCLYKPEYSEFLGIVSNMFSDTLEKLASIRKVQYIAYHDQLTGLPNRLLLIESLVHCLRSYDTVARIGGDEFVLLLDQISSTADLLSVMEKIMRVIRQPVLLQEQEFFMTGSAGVALYPQDGEDAETLIANADIAMYRAKTKGKNSYKLCSQDMKDEIIGQMKMTNLLYRALEKKQLIVYYQPQVNLGTGKIVGLEALLRWKLPEKGLVSPGVFIPLAEKSGQIQPIGRWVLKTACCQSKLWQEQGFDPVRMAVNVSVQQLASGSFVEQVADVLRETGLSPKLLELEVTESVANSGAPGISKTFTELKKLGVSLSIDDFGTEYSSLNRLKLLPVDRLKLDIQFVRGIESSEKDRAITKTIITLAKSLNMQVIAEGVETKPQLEFLNEKLCDEVQGFYYYKPMPADRVEAYLQRSGGGQSRPKTQGTDIPADSER